MAVNRRPPFPGVVATFMGRDALSLAISHLALKAEEAVLLPAYVCHEVVRPFVNRTRVILHDVPPDVTLDPDQIRKHLKADRIRLLVMINYFGFLQPHRLEIKALCAEHGAVLLEDCAHSLLTEGSGDSGDLSVYSFRKILPVSDGGGLRVNTSNGSPRPEFHPTFYSDLLSLGIMAKTRLNVNGDRFNRARFTSQAQGIVRPVSDVPRPRRMLPMSTITARRMRRLSYPEIVTKRREDYRFWEDVTRGIADIVPLFADLPPGVCPLGFPLKTDRRDAILKRAASEGVRLRVHWRLPSTVGAEFRTSHALSQQLLTLPLYPELSPRDRDVILRAIA
jgi:dTDP-4-amino-4,6-dideoxygalactose transaminase